MGFQYLTNAPLEEAKEKYLEAVKNNGWGSGLDTAACENGLAATEEIPVTESYGRRTAEAVYAHICAPHYPASAMDGIAVKASDTFGATETTPVILAPQQYVRVDTGDPLPEKCDAVVMIEEVV